MCACISLNPWEAGKFYTELFLLLFLKRQIKRKNFLSACSCLTCSPPTLVTLRQINIVSFQIFYFSILSNGGNLILIPVLFTSLTISVREPSPHPLAGFPQVWIVQEGGRRWNHAAPKQPPGGPGRVLFLRLHALVDLNIFEAVWPAQLVFRNVHDIPALTGGGKLVWVGAGPFDTCWGRLNLPGSWTTPGLSSSYQGTWCGLWTPCPRVLRFLLQMQVSGWVLVVWFAGVAAVWHWFCPRLACPVTYFRKCCSMCSNWGNC